MTAIAADAGPQWVNDLMDALGAPGAGLAIALENLFPPLPSEVILPLAGFAASSGRMSLLAVLLWTTAGSVIGALALYGIGALLGRDRTVAIAARLPLVKVSDIERTEAWFLKHGTKAVFFGRMIPIFRSLISVPAGVERMRLPVFLGLTTLGSAIWNTVFVLAGYFLGANWHQVSDIVSDLLEGGPRSGRAGGGWFIGTADAAAPRDAPRRGAAYDQRSAASQRPRRHPQPHDDPHPPSSQANRPPGRAQGTPAGSAPPPGPPVREAR